MSPLRRFVRRSVSVLWTTVTLVLVLLAIMVGVGKLLLPYSERYKPELEARLSDYLQQPVRVQSLAGDWKAFGPRLELRQLQILPADAQSPPVTTIGRAQLDIKPFNLIIPNRPVYRFRVIGAKVSAARDASGQVSVSGLGFDNSDAATGGGWLSRVGDIELEDAELRIDDAVTGMRLHLVSLDARLQMRNRQWTMDFESALANTESGALRGVVTLNLADSVLQSIDGYAVGDRIDLATWLPAMPKRWTVTGSGQSDFEIWLNWSEQQGLDILGHTQAEALAIALAPDTQPISADSVQATWRWERYARGHWKLDFKDLDFRHDDTVWQADTIHIARRPEPDTSLWVHADRVHAQTARQITQALMTRWPRVKPRWKAVRLDGWVSDFELQLMERWLPGHIKARGEQLAFSDWPKWPGAEGFSAAIEYVRGNGQVQFSGPAVTVEWPKVFRQPLTVGSLDCDLGIAYRAKGDWTVTAETCRLDNPALSATTDMTVSSNTGRPWMKAEIRTSNADLARIAPYWPDALMKPKAVQWLRQSLLAGLVTEGRIGIDGDLDNWPFDGGGGQFTGDFPVQGGTLNYADGWPAVQGLNAEVRIRNRELTVSSAQGQVLGVPLRQARADVLMNSPLLVDVSFQGRGDAGSIFEFVRRSPLDDRLQTDLSHLRMTGPAGIDGMVSIRSRDGRLRIDTDCKLDLDGAHLVSEPWQIQLDDIRGPLYIDETGFRSSDLKVRYRDKPATLSLGTRATAEGGVGGFSAQLDGQFAVTDLLPQDYSAENSWLDRLPGESVWQAVVSTGAHSDSDPNSDPDGSAGGLRLELHSKLGGTAINLPAPLNKPPAEEWPIRIAMPLGLERKILDIGLTPVGRALIGFDQQWSTVNQAAIQLGSGEPVLLAGNTFSLAGGTRHLDLDAWAVLVREQLATVAASGAIERLDQFQVAADRLVLLNREFGQTELALNRGADFWEVLFDGERIDGKLRIPGSPDSPIVADFDRLMMPKAASEIAAAGGASTSILDPASVPTMHLFAREFGYGDLYLENTRIEAYPRGRGLHFETIEGESGDLNFRASGNWFLTEEHQQRSEFEIFMTSESLGGLLDNLDIDASLQGGQTLVHFDAWWPGSPIAFELARLNGVLDLDVVQGQILNAQPGAGRLLGLISIQALPKRLALDFRDVFDKGFAFDQAVGTFRLTSGVATTEDLQVKSSAAVITVSGETDLANKQYDQVISVQPGVGSTLPVIGALAGGPGGAAAGLALQGLLQKPLGEAAQVQYSIKGSWSEPVIMPIAIRAVEEEPSATEDSNTESLPR